MRIKKYAAVAMLAVPALILTGCSKPSEADLHKNLVEDVQEQGLPEDQATTFADCATPKLHEELSASSIETIIEDGAVGAMIDEDDAKAGDKIITDCLNEVTGA